MLSTLWVITGSFFITLLILLSGEISTQSGIKIGINQVSTLESKSGVISENSLIIGNPKFTNNNSPITEESTFPSSKTFLQNFVFFSGRLEGNLRIQVTQLVRGHVFIYHDIDKQTYLTADLNSSNSI
jgi:hypothetical protein